MYFRSLYLLECIYIKTLYVLNCYLLVLYYRVDHGRYTKAQKIRYVILEIVIYYILFSNVKLIRGQSTWYGKKCCAKGLLAQL